MDLMGLPDAVLTSVVDCLSMHDRRALRACCRSARTAVDLRTQKVGATR